MIRYILLLALLIISKLFYGHAVQRDPVTNQITNPNDAMKLKGGTEFQFQNSNLNQKNDSLNYSEINGSPFWNDDYIYGELFSGSKLVTTLPIKLNLVTNEVYFKKDTSEMVMENNSINKIVFKAGMDSIVFVRYKTGVLLNGKTITGFLQILCFGKIQLLKHIIRKVKNHQSVTEHTIEYNFTDLKSYFINDCNKIESLRKLNKESIFTFIPQSNDLELWAKENNINFKKESDVILFVNHYNSLANASN